MSSSHPIIIISDSDNEDASSSTTVPVPPVLPTPVPSLSGDTEPFEDDETAPTPPIPSFPVTSALVVPSSSAPVRRIRRYPVVRPDQTPFGRPYRLHPNGVLMMRTARKRVRSLTLIPRPPTITGHPVQFTPVRPLRTRESARKRVRYQPPASPLSPSSPTLPSSLPLPPELSLPSSPHLRDPIPVSDLPHNKRARLSTPVPSTTPEPDTTPPCMFEIGESSRAAATRQPDIPVSRIEDIEEEIEGLVAGRVAIDQAYDGLETGLQGARDQISGLDECYTSLRQEMFEIFDRLQHEQEMRGRLTDQHIMDRARIVTLERIVEESRERERQTTELVTGLVEQVRDLQHRLGGASGSP